MIHDDFERQALKKTPTELAKHFNKSRSTIYRWFEKTGIEPYTPDIRSNDVWTARKEEIYAYYCQDGLTLREIGEKYNTTARNVFEAIKNHFPEFRELRNKKNLVKYIRSEYLGNGDGSINSRQKQEIEDWLIKHGDRLHAFQDKFLSTKQEDAITYFQARLYD